MLEKKKNNKPAKMDSRAKLNISSMYVYYKKPNSV